MNMRNFLGSILTVAFLTLVSQAAFSQVFGPSSSTVGDLAEWNNTTGTLLKDVPVQNILSSLGTFDVMSPAYGAVCNGTTDDHAAIQSAITAAVAAGGG